MHQHRTDPSEHLRDVALTLFAKQGYAATSIQQIADAAGYSKASVLYHFASKERLLEAVLMPIREPLISILRRLKALPGQSVPQDAVHDFVEFLLANRRQLVIFVAQGYMFSDVRSITELRDELEATVVGADIENPDDPKEVHDIRLGIVLGGVAYILAFDSSSGEPRHSGRPEIAPQLTHIVTQMLAFSLDDANTVADSELKD